jgi:hypothetical protein
VTGDWKIEDNEAIHIVASNQGGWFEHAYEIFVQKTEGMIQIRRTMRRCENYIKINLKEIGWENVVWINLYYDSDQWLSPVCSSSGFSNDNKINKYDNNNIYKSHIY